MISFANLLRIPMPMHISLTLERPRGTGESNVTKEPQIQLVKRLNKQINREIAYIACSFEQPRPMIERLNNEEYMQKNRFYNEIILSI